MTGTVLWDYPKSSASYRVRIALNLAGVSYQTETIDLLHGDQHSADHLARNPQGLVPVLDIDGHRFTQSLAILDYLDQTRNLGLLPEEPALQARVRALACALAVDVHPVCNLSVVRKATGGEEPARTDWMHHFIASGLRSFETMLGEFRQIPFATSDAPGLADICLIPQLYNADRWKVPYATCTRIRAVQSACEQHPAFLQAQPA